MIKKAIALGAIYWFFIKPKKALTPFANVPGVSPAHPARDSFADRTTMRSSSTVGGRTDAVPQVGVQWSPTVEGGTISPNRNQRR